MAKKSNAKLSVVPVETRLDVGCGKNKKEGFIGIDQYKMDGVDVVMDVRERWPYDDDSVDEVYSSHFIEHLTGEERVRFFNEMYRVLKPGCKAVIITPHWASNRAYGDFTHQWPPVAEMMFYYLSKKWRETDAPHTDVRWNPNGYSCDFECTWGYGMRPDLLTRNSEYQQFAMQNYKEACMDTHCTMIKKA
jgi:SAM-dependent methyltransferase